MSKKFLKIWYIVIGSLAGVSVLYYIILLIDWIANPNTIEGTWLAKLNPWAIMLGVIALLMMLAIIPITKVIEKKQAKLEALKSKDKENLSKYKSKKTK